MSLETSITAARDDLRTVMNRAAHGGETVYLTENGRRTIAVVPTAAAELLEDLEDLIDIGTTRAALAAVADGGDNPEPFIRRTDGARPPNVPV